MVRLIVNIYVHIHKRMVTGRGGLKNVQDHPWNELLRANGPMEILWRLPASGHLVLRMLGRLEHEHIHITTVSSSIADMLTSMQRA